MDKSSFVVIPNWNGIDFIDACLKSLQAQTSPHTVIVVENGSTDGSAEFIAKHHPEVQLLKFPDNAGFAGGVNRGIREAMEQGAKYIALLNNDAEADPKWLEHLVKALDDHPEAGAVAAKIQTSDGHRLDSTGDFYSVWGLPYPRGRGEADTGQYDDPGHRDIFSVSGGASLYRTAMFEAIGLFDEDFFAYYEDMDISFRGQLAGWRMLYEPSATVLHHIGGTSSKLGKKARSAADGEHSARPSSFARYHAVKNFFYVYTKNMPGWLYWKYLPLFWASAGLMFISDTRRGLLSTNLRAGWTALQHMPAMLAARRKIQGGRKLSLKALDQRLTHSMPPLQRRRFEQLGLARPPR